MAIVESLSHPDKRLAPAPFRLLVFGGSAGAIPALKAILAELPGNFSIPIVVVQHLGALRRSTLPEVLGRQTALRCKWAEHGEVPRQGTVLIAPPGSNMLWGADGTLVATPGPKPRLGWPSIDMFLTSATVHLGQHMIAIILSGMLQDGTDGISAVRRRGGATIAQAFDCADFADMPTAAAELGKADLRLPIGAIIDAVKILAECGVD